MPNYPKNYTIWVISLKSPLNFVPFDPHMFFILLCTQMNFKKNVVPPTKKPLFGQGNDFMMQPPRRSISLLTLFVVIICTFVLAFLLFNNFDRISNRFSSSIESTT